MLSPLHKNFAISQRFLALAGAAPSDSAKQDMVAKLYEDPPDNCDDLIDEVSPYYKVTFFVTNGVFLRYRSVRTIRLNRPSRS